jgi:hypothetical protein
MPPTDPREAGITPSRIMPPPVPPLDLSLVPKTKRSRSSDVPLKKRPRLCRNTAMIGGTQFRCGKPKHDQAQRHSEDGVVTDRTGHVIMKYSFSWEDVSEPLTIRTQTNATKPNHKN